MEMRWHAYSHKARQQTRIEASWLQDLCSPTSCSSLWWKNTENSFSSPMNQVWVSHLQRKALHLRRGDPVAHAYSPLKPAVLKREAKDKYKWEDTYDSGILKLVSSTIDSLLSVPLFQSSGLIYLFYNRRTWNQGATDSVEMKLKPSRSVSFPIQGRRTQTWILLSKYLLSWPCSYKAATCIKTLSLSFLPLKGSKHQAGHPSVQIWWEFFPQGTVYIL